MDEKEMESNYVTLTDENGDEIEFEVIAQYEKAGQLYFAMIPAEDDENDESDVLEYIILKLVEEDGEEALVTIDDDDEALEVENYFDNLFNSEIDYD